MNSNTPLSELADRPFQLLREMESRARNADLRVQRVKTEWLGVGVCIDQLNYLIPQEQVLEILKIPGSTRVPGSPRWMLGLSNVRGTLFPVVDVKLFCGDEPTVIGRDSRIILVNSEPAPVAIVVDEVFGFRRFPMNALSTSHQSGSPLDEYVLGVFAHDDATWSALDVIKLIATGGVLATTH